MSDGTLPPEPENIPLVVPDLTPVKPHCHGLNKLGGPCSVHPLKGEKYCLGHAKRLAPELCAKWKMVTPRGADKNRVSKSQRAMRRNTNHYSKEELMAFLTERLELVKERFGQMVNPETEEMICNLIRTMVAVNKMEVALDDDKKKTMPALEYEVKEPDARATA